jgi:hypothetical protein
VRLEAVAALGDGTGARVVSALMLATQDPHLSVRDAAVASLERVRKDGLAARDAELVVERAIGNERRR